MAFMGRGDRPSIGDNNTSNCQHGGPFLYSRFYYYIPLDNTYVIMELIATTIFCYDEFIKSSNNKGFLLQTI